MPAENTSNIFLTGFMGTGKTTVGLILAELLQRPFVDLDKKIEQREGCTIAEIFASHGENYFRESETVLLKSLTKQQATVYATGGGIVGRKGNRQLMRSLGHIVYLKASWSILQLRLEKSTGRPLIDENKGWDAVKSLWEARLPLYEKADIVIDTDGLTPLDVAHKIITGLAL